MHFSNISPASSVCTEVDFLLTDLSLPTCQESFCTSGVEGYEEFVGKVVAWMKTNGLVIGGISSFVVLLQAVLISNLWSMRRKEEQVSPEPRVIVKK